MRKSILVLIFIISFPVLSVSQAHESNIPVPVRLESLFRRIRGNLPDNEKTEANDSIISIIDTYSNSDSAFSHRFTSLKFLGQVLSPDSLVKIINWNLVLEQGKSTYCCYVIRREKKQGAGISTMLKAEYSEMAENSDSIFNVNNWYGALYYDIRPFSSEGITRYVVLGIDYGNPYITRKIIDVLSFGPKGEVTFGHSCFSDGKRVAKRIVFEYSSKAVMSLKFESDKTIVFDHLSPVSPEYRNDRQFYGPDFSFDSFSLENGIWKYRGDIDIKNK